MTIKIFFAVIIGELFSGLYFASRKNKYVPTGSNGFAVAAARVIDIARRVFLDVAVDGLVWRKFEKIFTLVLRCLFFAYRLPDVFDDAFVFWNVFEREEAFTSARLSDAKFVAARSIFGNSF